MPIYEVEIIIKEIYKVEAPNAVIAEFIAEDHQFGVIKSCERIKTSSKLVENDKDHSKEKRTKIETINGQPTNGDLFTMEKFKEMVDSGIIIDYDGRGAYSDGVYEYHYIYTVKNLDKSYSHVVWYNK
jgi:hypothetical protein